MKKICRDCKENLSVKEFSPKQGRCKACRRAHRIKTDTNNGPAKRAKAALKRREKNG